MVPTQLFPQNTLQRLLGFIPIIDLSRNAQAMTKADFPIPGPSKELIVLEPKWGEEGGSGARL